MAVLIIQAAPLTAESFAPFGDVIASTGRDSFLINEGTCERFDDLAQVDIAEEGGRPLISIFSAAPRAEPLWVKSMERHPMSSQAFIPLQDRPFLIVVADPGAPPTSANLRAFLSTGQQGVNYRRGCWHHSLIALRESSRFIVIDRGGSGRNCDEVMLVDEVCVRLTD